MKHLYLIALLLLLPKLSQAQFPAFANFEGSRIYVDSSSNTRQFRDVFSIGDQIDAAFAFNLANSAKAEIEAYRAKIKATEKDPNLSLTKKNEIITALQNDIAFMREVRNYYSSINKFAGRPKIRNSFFPVSRAAHSRFFYQGPQSDNVDFLSNFILQSNIDKTAISSDLISGALAIFQVTLSTTVTDNSDTTTQEMINDKLLYGALLNGRISYPLFYRANQHIAVYIPVSLKASVDNVAVNDETSSDDTFYFGEISSSIYMRVPIRYTSSGDNVSFFTNAKAGYIGGGDKLYEKLGNVSHGFWLSQATVGIEVNNKFRIAVNVPIYSSEKSITNNNATTIGIQVDPKFLTSE